MLLRNYLLMQEVVEALQSRKEDLKSQLGISNMDLEKAREDLR